MKRIHRRLAIQHSRWLLRQPISERFWFRTFRVARRLVRCILLLIVAFVENTANWLANHRVAAICLQTIAIVITLCLVLTLLVLGCGIIVVAPSAFLLLTPDRRPLAVDTEILVALTRLTLLVSCSIPFLWSILPGSTRRNVREVNPPQGKRRYSFLRRPESKRSAVTPRVWFPLVGGFIGLVMIALGGVLIRLEHWGIALACALLFTATFWWLVFRVGLRLMRHRARVIWHFTGFEYATGVFACLFAAALLTALSPVIVDLSRALTWLGPFGSAMGHLHRLWQGEIGSLLSLCAVCVFNVGAGWWISRDAASWANRRKLVEASHLLNRSEVEEKASSNRLTSDDLAARIQRDLDQSIEASKFRSWHFYLRPNWIGRRKDWFCVLLVTLSLLTAGMMGIRILFTQFEHLFETVQTVGGPQGISPQWQLIALLIVPFTFVLLGTETIAIFDQWKATSTRFHERPISPWQYFRKIHWDGISHLPIQLTLALPFTGLLYGTPSLSWTGLGIATLCTIGCMFAVRTLVICLSISESIRAIGNRWLMSLLNGILFVSLLYSVPLLAAASVSVFRSDTSIGVLQFGILVANAVTFIMFLSIVRLRASHETAAERLA